jgi:hypothetical protein
MEYPERPAEVAARDVIAHLQQSVQALVDGDRVLPDEGLPLLAALDRALAGPNGERVAAAQGGIMAFVGWVQTLIAAGLLEAADGLPRIKAAAALEALLRSADGIDPEADRRCGDRSQG